MPIEPLLLASFPGPELPEAVARRLADGVAGVVLFARNMPSEAALADLCRAIREVKPDALITVDEEGGEVTRLEAAGGSSWPGARALGVVDDPALTGQVAGRIAARLAAGGANVNLAPVADVETCAGNPVIGNRSFGADPDLVSRHVVAWVRASQAAGVAACAKHFPGHGATTVDSHLELPVVDLSYDELMAQHVGPFAAAIDAGIAMVMTAHVVYPQLDAAPGTASARLLTDLARRQLGFDGVICTDALDMGAIARGMGVVAGALGAVTAGADLLCVTGGADKLDEVIAGLRDAAASGDLPSARIEQATERVTRLARAYRPQGPTLRPAGADDEDRALGLDAARRAIGYQRLPAPLPSAPYVLELSSRRTGVGDIHARLGDALRQLDPAAEGQVAAADALPEVGEVLARAGSRPLVIATRSAGLRPAHTALVGALLAARPDAVVVGLGSAHDRSLAPDRFVAGLGAAPPNVRAVAEVLTGTVPSPAPGS